MLLLSGNDALHMARIDQSIGVVKINCEEPFTLSSGLLSPIKLDFDALKDELSRTHVLDVLCERLPYFLRKTYPVHFERLGFVGVPDGGVWWAKAIADTFNSSFVPSTKETRVRGVPRFTVDLRAAQSNAFVVVEDFITTAASTVAVIQQLRMRSKPAYCAVSLFSYSRSEARERLGGLGINHAALVHWSDLRATLSALESATLAELDEWYADPAAWTTKMEYKHRKDRI